MWVRAHFGRSPTPPPPHYNWRTLTSSRSPSLPTLSLPLPPHPPGPFCNDPGEAKRPKLVLGRVFGRGGGGGTALQATLGARPTSGGTRKTEERHPLNVVKDRLVFGVKLSLLLRHSLMVIALEGWQCMLPRLLLASPLLDCLSQRA